MNLDNKRILVTGGTGSLGGVLVHKLMSGMYGSPAEVRVLSRDEDKQHTMRLFYQRSHATNGNGNGNGKSNGNGHSAPHPETALRFCLGDVRDYNSVVRALRDIDVVLHAAALKQVPNCEYHPQEAVQTNVMGPTNIVRAIAEHAQQVQLVVGISTDKACEPINVMGMTKALQERILIEGNLECSGTRFVCVRYGNVIASRGSVIPIFLRQIESGGPLTLTDEEMTRFLITLEQSVETVMAAIRSARPGEIYVPKIPAVRMVDVARVLMEDRDVPIVYTGIRPGEKLHEVLVSDVERHRTTERDDHYAIRSSLPELAGNDFFVPALAAPFTSRDVTCDTAGLRKLLGGSVVVLRHPTLTLASA